MKLYKDFGVRALIALIALVGFYATIGIVLVRLELTWEMATAIIAIAQAPAVTVIAFYFGTKMTQPKE